MVLTAPFIANPDLATGRKEGLFLANSRQTALEPF